MVKKIRKRQGCLENFQGKNKNISIGIIGAVPGCGVTTMSVAIANYLAGITRKKVAVYEYNGKRTFMKMNEYLDNELIVCKDRCTYFPKGSVSLALLYNEDFPIVVVDFGTEKMSINEFARCTYKIVVGSLEPWNMNAYNDFINLLDEVNGSDSWLWIINGDKKSIKKQSKHTSLHIVKRPYIDNPFIINGALVEFFDALF